MKMTKVVKPHEVQRDWILIDAEGQTFGRILTQAATYLRGKHKPSFTPNVDCGDYVVIINAEKAKFTGNKLNDKEYFTYSGYFGSTRSKKLGDMLENHTEKLFKLAVRGMLPKTNLGKAMLKKLKVYAGSEHPHTAQFNKGSN
ncbi:MAG: 50S ribosomal protein L13 [Sulfurovum sp. FS08-3]|nr:MAG: 50S ribosomal protein L13 [Sulfurovum sp. FS08-3]